MQESLYWEEGMLRVPRPPTSVCMATFNGSRHVQRQIASILAQLGPDDEIVVVDDASTDNTVELLRNFHDPRIRVFENEANVGHVKAFARALACAIGEVVVLSDQDDVWTDGRMALMRRLLQDSLVCATSLLQDNAGIETKPSLTFSDAGVRTEAKVYLDLMLGRGAYFGCAMGLRRDALELVLPIPRFVEAHDHWIALAGGVAGGVATSSELSLVRTIHTTNLTPVRRRSLWRVASTRLRLTLSVVVLHFRQRRLH